METWLPREGVFTGGVNAGNGDLRLIGSDFRYEGELVTGLDDIGDVVFQSSATPTSSRVGLITGTLADGTPIALTAYDLTLYDGVRFQLAETILPPAPALTVASEEAPRFAVKNQSITVVAGGVLRQGFTAGAGARVEIQTGGVANEQLEAIGATIEVLGGEVGKKSLVTAGSLLEISAGTVGSHLSVRDGSLLRVLDGSIGDLLDVRGASTVEVFGGSLGETTLYDTSSIQVAGGYVGKMNAEEMSQIDVSGGRMVESPKIRADASLTLHGSGFLLDGVPVEQLVSGPFAQLGDTATLNLGVGQILTGELADGTPVVLAPTNLNRIADGTMTLLYDQPAASVPATFLASAGPTPAGIRAGQELRVDAGATVYSPIAGPGGRIEVQPGGTVTGALDASTQMFKSRTPRSRSCAATKEHV